MSYDPDPDSGLLPEEYVDVYGIPFSVIPFKGRVVDKPAPEDRPRHHVYALPERQEEMEIRFPIVEGYAFALRKNMLRCDVDQIEPLSIDRRLEPTATFVRPAVGYVDGRSHEAPFELVREDREAYYETVHFQTTVFEITRRIVDDLLSSSRDRDAKGRVLRLQARHQLFPQVFVFVREFVRRRVDFNGVDRRELGLEKYTRLVVERVRDAIYPDDRSGEPPLVPILNRYRPCGSTSDVDFTTTRPVLVVERSHINGVVQHSGWEAEAAETLETCDVVQCYARNDHLGLLIPYEYLEVDHSYEPDFVVRLANGVQVIVEIKGYEVHNPEQTNQKHNAARRWCTAVNNLGEFGHWEFLVCRDLGLLIPHLRNLASGRPAKGVAPVEARWSLKA